MRSKRFMSRLIVGILIAAMSITSAPISVYAEKSADVESVAEETLSDTETKMSEETAGEERFEETQTDIQEIGKEGSTDESVTDIVEPELSTDEIQDSKEEPATETLEQEEPQTDVEETVMTEELDSEKETEALDSFSVDLTSVNGYTRQSAADWIKSREGTTYGSAECVDLVKLYTVTLGHTLTSIGYAYNLNLCDRDYTNQYGVNVRSQISSWGWNWYNNSTTPMPGDIVVFDANKYGAYWTGHCGLIYAVDANKYHYIDYNGGGNHEKGTPQDKGLHEFSCIIRPDFPADIEHGSAMSGPFVQFMSDGDYHIVSALEGDRFVPGQKCLTIGGLPNLKDTNGANAELGAVNGWEDHVFTVTWLGDDKGYKIKLKNSDNKCLDVCNTDTAIGTNVRQYRDTGAIAQQWVINETTDGNGYTIQARCSGYFLDVVDGKTADATNIRLWSGNGSNAQRWYFVPWGGGDSAVQKIPNGEYEIVSKLDNSKCLSTNGTNVELNTRGSDERHIFQVTYLGNGYYKMENKNSKLSLDVTNGESKRGTNVGLYKYWETYNEQWIIKPCSDGYFYIISRCNGLCVDLAGSAISGTNISMWSIHGGDNQKWKFISAQPKIAPPTPSISSGTEVYPGTVLKFYPVAEGTIYYTSDGTDPKTSATKKIYDSWGITIEEPTTIKAYKVMDGYQDSDVVTLTYKVLPQNKLSPPIPDVPSGSVVQANSHVMLDMGNAEVVYYTRDGTNPKSSDTREKYQSTITGMNGTYPLGIIIYNTVTIKAYAERRYYEDSDIVEFTYIVGNPSENPDPTEPDPTEPGVPDDNAPDGLWLAEIKPQTYTGKAIKPEVRVYDHKTLLKEKKDYTLSYKNNTNASDANGLKPPTVIVTGKGNYKGKESQTFTISPKNLADADITADNIALKENGKAQKPVPTITWNNKKLAKKKDYTISYPDEATDGAYVKTGTYFIRVKGAGNYTGERTITLTITQDAVKPSKKISLNKANAELQFGKIASYTGNAVKPDRYTLTFTTKDAGGNNSTVTLKEGSDYKVSYQNNVKAGKASILFQGINNYSGTLRKDYNIAKYDIETDTDKKIKITLLDAYAYTKGGCKPKPIVMFGKTALTEGTDYTLSYQNNTNLSDNSNTEKAPTVIIKGKGNFNGTCKETFAIRPKDIGTLTLTAADKTWQNKSNIYKTKIVIKDEDGKALNIGKDYNNTILYEYDSAVTLDDGTTRNAGETVSSLDIIPAGTTIRVTAKADGENYTGTLTGTYRIVKADIGKASVKIPPQIYTGKPIEPDKSQITVKLKGQTLSETYYDISCSNNINKGTATMIIKGKNDCGGTKTVTFKIKEKGFLWWWR